ncbi:OsmC family protein [Mucilaginibacter sp. KACC 22063]|uniref:OsmC family protein n=1 Tax=Mucilaginibacter sp. KACC 22063 TaxID=3025666 RepID=UPI00236671BE|nr:OsmC family protein [Mucilaginibacter sp. KACC 22063]WDF53977.1 OsmC family protein [Mucilaginibacter sp. KACC 22063]
MQTIELSRVKGDFGFEAKDANGHVVRMDSSPESGGWDYGVRPMQMLLMGLGGCAGIDVISILKKQRQDVKDYKMTISGDREAGVEPSLWKNVTIEFHIYGNVDEDKARRAVDLSLNKYCSVAATLKGAGAQIESKVFVHKS